MDQIVRFTNYFEHPSDNRYMVYVYYLKTHADHFQNLLQDRDVVFERYLDPESERQRILFGVSKRYLKDANQCNFLTHAEFRKPFIKNRLLGVTLVVVTLAIIALSIVGYIKS
ncbi:MAG: hypothetical protein AB8F74_05245 [Saprospiraceae bacterium]